MARLPSIFVIAALMREAAVQACSCISSCLTCRRNPPPPPAPRVPQYPPLPPRASHWRLRLSVLLLILAVLVACPWVKSHMKNKWMGRHYFNNHYFHHDQDISGHGNHVVTILAATYGGRDVTNMARDYYARVASLRASNDVYGDPLPGIRKYLHVVYQVSTKGFTEVVCLI